MNTVHILPKQRSFQTLGTKQNLNKIWPLPRSMTFRIRVQTLLPPEPPRSSSVQEATPMNESYVPLTFVCMHPPVLFTVHVAVCTRELTHSRCCTSRATEVHVHSNWRRVPWMDLSSQHSTQTMGFSASYSEWTTFTLKVFNQSWHSLSQVHGNLSPNQMMVLSRPFEISCRWLWKCI